MRLYVPATLNELDSVSGTSMSFEPRRAHTATAALVKAYEAEGISDIEEVEFGAFMAAADDSLMLIAEQPDVPWKRFIISVDVPDAAVKAAPRDDETPISAVDIVENVGPLKIVCVHVDEPDAAGDVQGVFEGKEEAIIALNERDLLWYDASELSAIPR